MDISEDSGKPHHKTDQTPFDLGSGIFWVGKRSIEGRLDCNPYLIREGKEAVLLDPGSPLDFDTVLIKVQSICPLEQIKLIVVHHQDPDLCASLPLFEKAGLHCPIALHWRTSVMVKYYGQGNEFYLVNQNGWKWSFSSGRTLRFHPAYYCHFPGAVMTYDEVSRTLFSGDVFGAFIKESTGLFAGEDYGESMKSFHEHYMPSREILRAAIEGIRGLALKTIAPQHGRIIRQDLDSYMEILRDLPCGSYAPSSVRDRLEHKAEDDIMTDRLTGLKNQYFHNTYMENLLNSPESEPWGAVYLELTNLTEINRNHGREAGDETLKGSAYYLNRVTGRKKNWNLCKLNSPVFVLTGPAKDEDILYRIAGELMDGLRQSSYLTDTVTLAAAVTHIVEEGRGIPGYKEWDELNKAKLLLSKRKGNNTICSTINEANPGSLLNRKVLLVDSESSYESFLEKSLSSSGIELKRIDDGINILERGEGWRPDIIISEAMTPKLNGFEFKERLNALPGHRNIPFILVSQRKDEEYINRAADLSIVHYLKKPFSLTELEGLIRNLLESKRDI